MATPAWAVNPSPVAGIVAPPPRLEVRATGRIKEIEANAPAYDTEFPTLCLNMERVPLLTDEDREYARTLLAEVGVETGDALIVAEVRDSRIERADGSIFEATYIYCEQHYEGIPVLHGRVGFTFYHNDSDAAREDKGIQRTLETLVGDEDVEADLSSQVGRGEALDIYRRAGIENRTPMQLPASSHPSCDPRVELVLWNEVGGQPTPPHYRLVWNVRPASSNHPQAIIDAKYGEVLYFDDGIRY
jgi:hypothetical protein